MNEQKRVVMIFEEERNRLIEYLMQAPMVYVEQAVNFLRELKTIELVAENKEEEKPEEEESLPTNPYIRKT